MTPFPMGSSAIYSLVLLGISVNLHKLVILGACLGAEPVNRPLFRILEHRDCVVFTI